MKYLFLLILLAHQPVVAQQVAYSKLDFHSEIEKLSFSTLHTTQGLPFSIFLSINPDLSEKEIADIKKNMEAFWKLLEKNNIKNKKPKNALKLIFKYTHQEYLKTYDEDAQFDDVFYNGDFNCLTATIFVSLTLDHFGYTYEVRTTPTHVYILANINSQIYLIETTDAQYGFRRLHKKDQDKYLGFSSKVSTIDKKKQQENGFRALAGNLYYNKAILKFEKGWYDEARSLQSKARYLYPDRLTNTLQISKINDVDLAIDWSDLKSFDELLKLLEVEMYYNEVVDLILNTHQKLANHCFSTNETNQYWSVYNYLQANTKNYPKLRLELQKVHYLQLAAQASHQKKTKKALKYLDQALFLSPKDPVVQSNIFHLCQQVIIHHEIFTRRQVIDQYILNYPFIVQFEAFKCLDLLGEAGVIAQSLEVRKPKKAFEQLELLKMNLDHSNSFHTAIINITYDAFYRYYLGQSHYFLAQQMLEEGLKLAPESKLLGEKLQSLEKYMVSR